MVNRIRFRDTGTLPSWYHRILKTHPRRVFHPMGEQIETRYPDPEDFYDDVSEIGECTCDCDEPQDSEKSFDDAECDCICHEQMG